MIEKVKTDRRIQKTESAIFNALINILSKKNIGDISIRQLTEEADIHRATFYDHYADIYDCFNALQNSVLDEFQSVLKSSPERNYRVIYKNVLDFVCHKQTVLEVLLGENGSMNFQSRFMQMIEEDYLGNIQVEFPSLKRNKTWNYIATYHTYGNYGAINRWILNRCDIPVEEMLELLLDMDDLLDGIYRIEKDVRTDI